MAVTGKLCRNPFSTINLPHEHGGSKAVSDGLRGLRSCAKMPFFSQELWIVAARSGAVYSECLGRERDSGGERGCRPRGHQDVNFSRDFSPMAELFSLSAPDLAALLCSRVCHDIISPVGAINNGLELLDEGGADEDAMRLIRQSAKNASARLQFARIAFGAAGSAGMMIDTGDAEAVAIAFLKNEKPELVWKGTRALLPKNKVKLLLNLLLVA